MKVNLGLMSLILVLAMACSAPESDSVENGTLPGVSAAGGSTDSGDGSSSTGTTDESETTGTTDESGSTDSADTGGSTGVTDAGSTMGTTDDSATGGTDDGSTGTTDEGGIDPTPVALLEIYALDIWAQTLPVESTTITVTVDGVELAAAELPKNTIELTNAMTYHITLESADHVTASVHITFDGSADASATKLLLSNNSGSPGTTLGHAAGDGDKLPVHTLYVGLQHNWFSSQGAPARRGNQIQLLMNGENAWAQVYKDIKLATKSALVSTWWWDSEFELVRDYSTHHTLTSVERWKNTMMGVLESSPLHIRLLVGEFWGTHDIVDWLNTDDAAAYYANKINDEFEVMGQGNSTADIFLFEPVVFAFGQRVIQAYSSASAQYYDDELAVESPISSKMVDLSIGPLSVGPQMASWHQKFMVLDGKVAFVGGMNIKAVDWDTSKHSVFEHRRMAFDATEEDRLAVLSKSEEPDFGPRKDYIMRVEGPSAQDVAVTFQTRWSQLIDNNAAYSDMSSKFSVDTTIAALEEGLQVQVTTTMPQPNASQSIGETWLKAVEQAQDYILIEDQYWRVPLVAEAILDRMEVAPNLRLVVITKPVDTWVDPGCEWTHIGHQWFKTQFPERYRVYQLRAFDVVKAWGINETEGHFNNIDLHAKMFIVDDKFMSVGSANKNNRGILYEGEMNIAVLDSQWVKEERQKILSAILPKGTLVSDEVDSWWTQLSTAAAYNELAYAKWENVNFELNLEDPFGANGLPDSWIPQGFLYPLEFGLPEECFIQGVGPDLT